VEEVERYLNQYFWGKGDVKTHCSEWYELRREELFG
jgi:hypothetical protein